MASVRNYLKECRREAPVHFTLIDPANQTPVEAGKLASHSAGGGTNAFLVGGSTGLTFDGVDATVRAVKRASDLPVILFPSGADTISPEADAILFMSMLNSTKVRFIIGEQLAGAPIIEDAGLETLSTAYLVVEPGMRVAEVGGAQPLPRDDLGPVRNYTLMARMLGMEFIYLEAGSHAPDPVPARLVSSAASAQPGFLMIGGGIRHVDQVRELVAAGADGLITGTLVEKSIDVAGAIDSIVSALAGVA